jgi:hypothetical protein
LVCLFCWRKYVDRSWDYIIRSQTHECGNWGWGCAIPRKGIHKWDLRCSAAVFSTAKLYIWRQSKAAGYHMTYVVFLHNHSCISQEPIPFLSKLKRQLKQLPIFRSPKAWVMCRSSWGLNRNFWLCLFMIAPPPPLEHPWGLTRPLQNHIIYLAWCQKRPVQGIRGTRFQWPL